MFGQLCLIERESMQYEKDLEEELHEIGKQADELQEMVQRLQAELVSEKQKKQNAQKEYVLRAESVEEELRQRRADIVALEQQNDDLSREKRATEATIAQIEEESDGFLEIIAIRDEEEEILRREISELREEISKKCVNDGKNTLKHRKKVRKEHMEWVQSRRKLLEEALPSCSVSEMHTHFLGEISNGQQSRGEKIFQCIFECLF
jgi:chromosome segregation ATPase